MPRDPYRLYNIPNMNGGLNTFTDPTLLKDNETPSCQNVDFDRPGKVSQRAGYERVGNEISSTLPPLGFGRLKIQSSGADYLVVKVDTAFRYLDITLQTTWQSIAGAYNASESTFDIYNDKLYVYNPVDNLLEWSGPGAFTAYAAAPKGKFGKIFQNRAYVAGVTGNLSTLYYSVIGTVTDFAGAGSGNIIINKNDGYSITGIGVSEGRLLVHKSDGGIYQVDFDGSSVPYVTKVAAFQGSIRHQTISTFENASIYLASDSVRAVGQQPYYPASQRDNEVSLAIRPSILSIDSVASSMASGAYIRNKYYLSVPALNDEYNDTVYTYAYGAWSYYQNVFAYGFIEWNGYVHFFDSRKAQLYRFSEAVKTDDGEAITSILRTKIYGLGDEANRKQILGINARMRGDEGTSIDVNYAPDLDDFVTGASVSPVNNALSGGAPAPAFGSYLGVFGSYLLPFAGSGASSTQSVFMSFRYSFRDHLTYAQVQFQHNSFGRTWELVSLDLVYSQGPWHDWNDINTTIVYQ